MLRDKIFLISNIWLIGLALQCLMAAAHSFSHVCYMNAPSTSPDTLSINEVDVDLCSHIIMGFATLNRNSTVNLNPLGGYKDLATFAALRERKSTLKLMISVKGDSNIKEMLWGASRRQRFVQSVASTLRAANLSGVDLDLKLPNILYAFKYVKLLEELHMELKKDPKQPLLLSVALPAKVWLLGEIYRVRSLKRWADFVNLMTYEFNTYHRLKPWVNHNSPLYPRSPALPYFRRLNVEFSAQLWVKMGLPKSKIMVGIPTFGLSWVLRNPDSWQIGSPATGRDMRNGGYVSFADVCSLLKNGTQKEYDDKAMVPYMHKGKLWVSYDDHHSVALKGYTYHFFPSLAASSSI
ncbi:acidic mammalian chitinase isoform X2 [Rhipicephalus sanguineus]|uniref:acidic mammalian chitinase isoform X2 n=1 Tax=Rhipicephalus sanguineus TaxID=34632 RepID=UPI0020C4F028|nr:acidic mammalian chitinase isoform X2 [Rhipicephalus sanguineus]